MKRLIAAGFALAVVAPATASAKLSHSEAVAYGRAYAHVEKAMGIKVAGCKLIGPQASCRHATDNMVRRSTDTLHRMLAPPPRVIHYAHYSSTTARSAPVSSSGASGYSIPSYIVRCESGGNWNAVNPSSGAGGAYQILPSTWSSYGGSGSPSSASPAEQSRIAAKIYAASGASAWSCG